MMIYTNPQTLFHGQSSRPIKQQEGQFLQHSKRIVVPMLPPVKVGSALYNSKQHSSHWFMSH